MQWFNKTAGIVLLCAIPVFDAIAVEPHFCPRSFAVIAKDPLSMSLAPTMQDLYRKLGCDVELSYLPGRRGIKHFNVNLVDGELLRLQKVEPAYTRPFVRSSVPILNLKNILWLHPDAEEKKRFPVGYKIGVVWQEQYAKNHETLSFGSTDEMIEAYRKGRLSGFFSAEATIQTWLKSNEFHPAPMPVVGEVLMTAPIFHYLGEEYRGFMEQLSDLMRDKKPFNPEK